MGIPTVKGMYTKVFIKQLMHDLSFGKYLYLGMAAAMILMGVVYTPPDPLHDFIYIPWWFFIVTLIAIICIIQVGRFFNKAYCEHTWHLFMPPNITLKELLLSKITTAMLWFNFIRGVYIIAFGEWIHRSTFMDFLSINVLAFFFINVLLVFIILFHTKFPTGKIFTFIVALIGWVLLYFWVDSSFFITIVFGIITVLTAYYLLTKCTVYVENNSIT